MKNVFFIPILFFTSLLLYQCQKEEPIYVEETTVEVESSKFNHLALSIDAEEFVSFFERGGSDFAGIFVKILDGEVFFQKINIVNNSFHSTKIKEHPLFSKVVIDGRGEIQNYNPDLFLTEKVEGISEDFDLTYFGWKELKMIAKNSKKLYFSGTKVVYGTSIHSTPSNMSSPKNIYSNLKIEGDFLKAISQKDSISETPTPMYLYGHNCPPYWR